MAVLAAIVIALIVLLTFIAVVLSIGQRAIVVEMELELEEALEAIAAARRFYERQSVHHLLMRRDYAK